MQSNPRGADESDDGSDEFFDAEESLPHSGSRHSRKRSPKSAPFVERFEFPVATAATVATSAPASIAASAPVAHFGAPAFAANEAATGAAAAAASVASLQLQPAPLPPNASGPMHEFLEPKTASRQRFRELRQCMQHDDDENPGNTLTPDSQNSSVEGVFPSTQRPTHPFRIIDDAVSIQSMTSLGRVGRILAGTLDAASLNADRDPSLSSGGAGCPSASSLSPAAPSPPAPALVAANVQPMPAHSMASSLVAAVATMSVDSRHQQQQQQQLRQGSPVQKINFSEPDVIASTKLAHSKTTDSLVKSIAAAAAVGAPQQQQPPPPAPSPTSTASAGVAAAAAVGPVAPPRRKKKTRKLSASSADQFQPNDSALRVTPLADSVSLKLDLNRANHRATAAKPIPLATALPAAAQAATPADSPQPQLQPLHPLSLSSPATAAIASLTREIENSFTDAAAAAAAAAAATASSTSSTSSASLKLLSGPQLGSMSRISHSLGNSSTSVYSKPSPSNSAKSNSAPAGRPHAIDLHNQGLNLYKATRGQYVVKPQDEAANKAEGPSLAEIERVERIRAEILSGRVAATSSLATGGAASGAGRASLVGTNSLGSGMRFSTSAARLAASAAAARERRKSAGDEDVLRQLNIYVRTRTDSGKQLSDFQILEQVPVKNLDTGERIPLSVMKPPPVPAGWNPLSLHIHKLTCHLEPLLAAQKESDEESVLGIPAETEEKAVGDGDEDGDSAEDGGRLRKKTARLKRFIGSTMRKTVDRAKLIASEVSHARHKEDVADIVDVVNPEQQIKIKASSTNKGPYEFTKLQHVQDLSGEHTGAVWCMKFSSCGRLLATAGQDRVLRIWVLKEAYAFFQDMRTKYNADAKSSPTPSQESLVSHNSAEDAAALALAADAASGPFMPKAFCTYTGHTSDLLDVSWSKNYFILSSSMDKTVRLWHISRRECLCCFQHIDFVTAIAFHPRDDRYFLSGSLDGKLRLWNIPDKKVALWNEVDGQTKLITAANFCQNGKFAVVGTYDGRCIFYNTDQLKYHTQIHVRSTRGRNKTGRKISGIEPMPGEDKILVTSNDSRVRLYDLRDLNLSCKYKGYANVSSQIKASFSNDGKYIVAGSENQCIYIWKTSHDYSKLSSVRRDRSDFWEGIKAHNATVTCAIFAPNPEAIIKPDPDDDNISRTSHTTTIPDPMAEQRKKSCGYVLISADFNGSIKVFINKTKPKHSSLPYTAICD